MALVGAFSGHFEISRTPIDSSIPEQDEAGVGDVGGQHGRGGLGGLGAIAEVGGVEAGQLGPHLTTNQR